MYVLLIGIACLVIGVALGFAIRLRPGAGKRKYDKNSRKDSIEENALCGEVLA